VVAVGLGWSGERKKPKRKKKGGKSRGWLRARQWGAGWGVVQAKDAGRWDRGW